MPQGAHPNPWLSMWTQPKATIRGIVQTKPRYGVFWLSTIFVLQNIFYYLNFWSMGFDSRLYSILLPSIALSPLLGFVWVYFYGWILSFTGRWLGGTAPALYVRSALAWSRLPMFICLGMWFFLFVSNHDYAFIQYAGGPSAFFVNFITLIVEIWSFVLLFQSIREIQHFSVGRSIANVFIAGLFYSVFTFLFILTVRFAYLM